MASVVALNKVVKCCIRGSLRIEVLHSITLDVNPGEFLALMGPAGSGKTTLLKMMVTHDPRAADHASHILYLDKGQRVSPRRPPLPDLAAWTHGRLAVVALR
jgi:ABC-type lipoprotein export system ATPase subunit